MTTKITILGCGNSTGVPMADGHWGDCDRNEPRNRRLRSSILIEKDGTTEQMLTAGVSRLDAVVFSHVHADHSQGIDDLRAFVTYGGTPLPIYGYPELMEQVRGRFSYMFGGAQAGYYDKAFLEIREPGAHLKIGALDLTLFEQDHVVCRTMGIRTGTFGYSTDVKTLPEAAFAALDGVKTWVVAAVRRQPHIAHAHLEQVLGWIERVKPTRAILTHLNLSMDYQNLLKTLPAGVEPAYDGRVIEIDG
jgi:phosphoribosyl 1,2-cyclic phosphate phosphodiesterase